MYAFDHHVMVVYYKYFYCHYAFNSINTEVPLPADDCTSIFPFKYSMRLCMLLHPAPFAVFRIEVSKPFPSSSTVIEKSPLVLVTCTNAFFAEACFMILFSNSCTTR